MPYSGNLESKLLPMDVQLSYEEKLSGLGDKLNMILIKVHVNTQLIHYLKSDKYIYNSYFIKYLLIESVFNKYDVLVFSISLESKTECSR